MVVIKLKTSTQQALPDTYKSVEDFYEDINTYEELIFEYRGQKYVVTYYDNQLCVSGYNKPDFAQCFDSPQDFAANFCIDGISFQDFINKISVLVR
ncbi:hypothetical protein [Sporomusa aerivorans]|uniref:hypothetical protein n=1 Tax=Sporomusa aerivorans TaxID=204936 RepID=UPI00352A714B